MNILFLSAWCPYPHDNGSKLRIYHLLRGLGRRHAVDLLAFCPEGDDGAKAVHLGGLCRQVQLLDETPFARRPLGRLSGLLATAPRSLVADHSPAMARLVARAARASGYDVIVASQLHMLPYALRARGAPVVLEELELALLRDQVGQALAGARRLRARLTWWKTARYLRGALGRVRAVSVASAAEEALLAGVAPRGLPRAVVPNGVDVAGCAGAWAEPEADTLIYPGALSYEANFDAVAHFLAAIYPLIRAGRPAARLRVTGTAAPSQIGALPRAEGVEFTGYLADVRPAVAGAWAEVVPLRKGGGTRLKVLEALALGTPVVATSKGVEGLGLRSGAETLVADTPDAFARETLRLLGSPELRRELAERGRAAAARFDWSHSVDRLDELLARAVARGAG